VLARYSVTIEIQRGPRKLKAVFQSRNPATAEGAMSAMIPINYWAVLAAALFTIALGFLWYGPLFGKSWMRHARVTRATMKPGGAVRNGSDPRAFAGGMTPALQATPTSSMATPQPG
jgi:hypothetical protein